MRFCPFCSAENDDVTNECASCARRLPPLPPRRRKNGLEKTAAIPKVRKKHVAEGNEDSELLGQRTKTLADLAVSPSAGRREVGEGEPVAAGSVERRRVAPPVPARGERDRLASMSTGVAPGLARESVMASEKVSEIEDAPKQAVEDPELEQWPAPASAPAPHPDEWTLEAPTPKRDPPPSPSSKPARAAKKQPAPRPTRVAVPEPFKAPDIIAVPAVPEAGLLPALKYTVAFGRARWQRRGAIGDLRERIRKDTGMLDGILGSLGRQARSLGVKTTALETENSAIDSAENRRKTAEHACSELSNRQAEENSKFANSEADREAKVSGADSALDTAQAELSTLESQRRELQDQRKSIEGRQKGYLKAADNRDSDSEKQETRERREELRAAASTLRQDAAKLVEERQEIDRRYDALEQPMAQLSSRVDALKSDRDAAKRGLTDLREGHRHRLAEIDAEQGRRTRELAQAEAEIERRYVTLGTLVNLNRVDGDEFRPLYEEIDLLRGAIGARSNQIDKLSAERHAFDKASLIRGAAVLGGIVLIFLALLAILLAAT